VGGAAGIIGGLGAFGGFVLPPVLGLFVRAQGEPGYAHGFYVFLGLAAAALALFALLKRSAAAQRP
jgi:NNP family nitrate/nitrite transporter-like MFS transporter